MAWIFKNKNKNSKTLLVVLFLVFSFFFSLFQNTSQAATTDGNLGGSTVNPSGFGGAGTAAPTTGAGLNGLGTSSNTVGNTSGVNVNGAGYAGQGTSSAPNLAGNTTKMEDASGNLFVWAIRKVLEQIQSLVGKLFAIAATLFAWAIEPANVSGTNGLLNKPAVKDVWIMVRDLLNMTFILVLLFAAFCTIFQVDTWNLKKVWLNILINALLVNFSYPIARFFIDVSNVAFYYFVNNLFASTGTVTGSGIFAMFGATTKTGELLMPGTFTQDPIAYQIAMIVLTFMLGMTLMIVAALFVIRLIALTMLVMFSPVGFVGYIFPSTRSYADKWWKQLFSYSFFGPIMIFIMAIALKIAESLKAENIDSMMRQASQNSPADQTTWIANAAFFTIPVIIMWMGIGYAKSSGGELAGKVVDNVTKGGKWLANAPGKYSGVYGATKKASEKFSKDGKLFGGKIPLMGSEGREAREAAMSGFVTGGMGGYNDARRNVEDKKIAEQMKEYKDRNYTSDIIAKDLDSKDSHTSQAAVRALIADKSALNDPAILAKVLQKTGNNHELRNKAIDAASDLADHDGLNEDSMHIILSAATAGMVAGSNDEKAMTGKIKGKVRKENVKKLLKYEEKYNKGTRSVGQIYEEELNKLNPESFGKQKKLHDDIVTDAALKSYVKTHYANPANKAAHQEVFSKMTNKGRAAWAADPTLVP
jgi:hypothetical protein